MAGKMVRRAKSFFLNDECESNLFSVASEIILQSLLSQRGSAGTSERRRAHSLLYLPMYTCFVGSLSPVEFKIPNERACSSKRDLCSSPCSPSTHPRVTLPLDHTVTPCAVDHCRSFLARCTIFRGVSFPPLPLTLLLFFSHLRL